MRKVIASLVLALVAAASGTAAAQSFVRRPLTVPESQFQLYGAWDFLRPCNGCADDEFIDVGLDIGINRETQVGIMGSFGVSPGSWLETAIADLQHRLSRSWSLRADMGMQRYEYIDQGVVHEDYGLVLGLGAPLKFRLNPYVAIIGGRPYSWAFDDDPENFLLDTDDIIALRAHGASGATIGIPLGLLVEIAGNLAIDVRSGYRWGIAGAYYDGHSWVPLGLDFLVNIANTLDLAASVDIPGDTGDYLARRIFRVWAKFRF